MNFKGKKVLVTGSTRSLGFGTAKMFMQLGATVCINGRSQGAVDKALAELDGGVNAVGVAGELGSAQSCSNLVSAAIEKLGGLDVLVNCAGVAYAETLEDTTEEQWDAMFDVNVKSVFFCSQAAAPALRESKGVIVNVSSDSGLQATSFIIGYCATKAACNMITKSTALALAPDVRVNAVAPGYIDTDMVRDAIAMMPDPAAAEAAMKQENLMNRFASVEEIAHSICYLASAEASYMTGSVLSIDGGSTAGLFTPDDTDLTTEH